eukprot:287798_1
MSGEREIIRQKPVEVCVHKEKKKNYDKIPNMDGIQKEKHNKRPGFCAYLPSYFGLIGMLMSVAALIVFLLNDYWIWWIPIISFVVFWCFYTFEWYYSCSMSYFSNIFSKNDFNEYIKQIQKCKVSIIFNAECYHYGTISGKAANEEKKITHQATMNYQYKSCDDVTSLFQIEDGNKDLIQLKLSKML